MANEHFAKKLWISFGIIVASIVIAAGALFIFSGDLASNAAAIVSARSVLNEQDAAVANLASLKAQAAQAAEYSAAMNQLVPDQYGLVTFTQLFATEGKEYNVDASAAFEGSVTPSHGTTPGGAAFSFTITGSLNNITSFMDFLSTKSPAFLVVLNSFNVAGNVMDYTATGQGTVISQ